MFIDFKIADWKKVSDTCEGATERRDQEINELCVPQRQRNHASNKQ
jgi:hypothetical protein